MFAKIPYIDKVLFTKHLSVMLKSGITLLEALTILQEQTSNPHFKKILESIVTDVANGKAFHKAIAKHADVFDPLYISLIKIGEESGNLERNLDYLAIQMRKNYDFGRKVQGALLYPTIVITVAIVVGAGLSLFVLPQLVTLFKSLDIPLPFTTRVLLFIAEMMQKFGYLIFAGLLIVIVFIRLAVNLPIIKPIWQKFVLDLPWIGYFFQNAQQAFFCRNLGLMLTSGLPITSALESLTLATDNLVFRKSVEKIKTEVENGKSIEFAIINNKLPYFPKILSRMIGVGEKSGNLSESLIYLGNFFEDEVDNTARNFSTVLEPIILFAIGLVVAFVALAIITPIYQLTGSIHP